VLLFVSEYPFLLGVGCGGAAEGSVLFTERRTETNANGHICEDDIFPFPTLVPPSFFYRKGNCKEHWSLFQSLKFLALLITKIGYVL
jgi:hypothetical protein